MGGPVGPVGPVGLVGSVGVLGPVGSGEGEGRPGDGLKAVAAVAEQQPDDGRGGCGQQQGGDRGRPAVAGTREAMARRLWRAAEAGLGGHPAHARKEACGRVSAFRPSVGARTPAERTSGVPLR